jgi:hypothetical protein
MYRPEYKQNIGMTVYFLVSSLHFFNSYVEYMISYVEKENTHLLLDPINCGNIFPSFSPYKAYWFFS